MDAFSKDTLEALARVQIDPCVSIFATTHRSGPDSRPLAVEDVTRWKSLVRDARERLGAAGANPRDVEALLRPADALIDDGEFWRYQGDGLAVFVAPDMFRPYRLPIRLEDLVVVGRRFHLTPLVPLLTGNGQFYVLALSQNEVRLVSATRDTAAEIAPGTAPRSLQEALRFDEPQAQLQHHALATGQGNRPTGTFHGHGVGTDDRKDRILRFCQQVDRGLAPLLRGGSAPLVLAAVDSVAAIYRQASSYPHLLDAIVEGNPERRAPDELRDRAWPLVEPFIQQPRTAALARYEAARATSTATGSLEAALAAAADGRVEVAFLPLDVRRWGTFDEATRAVERRESPREGDEELLNALAVRTLQTGGTVYALPRAEMPGAGEVAALFRY